MSVGRMAERPVMDHVGIVRSPVLAARMCFEPSGVEPWRAEARLPLRQRGSRMGGLSRSAPPQLRARTTRLWAKTWAPTLLQKVRKER